MIGHLFRKELREHRRTFLVLAVLESLMILLALGNAAVRREAATSLSVLHTHLAVLAPIGGSVLVQALIAKEVREKTILFLEALPVRRWQVLVAKLLLAALVTFGLTALSYAVVVWSASRAEPIPARFAMIIAAKATAFTAAVFGVLVLGAALGKYRYVLYLLLFLAAFTYDTMTGELAQLPPFSLIGPRFPVERDVLPARDLAIAVAAGVACTAFGFALLALRGGSVANLLGEKMSHREKVMVAVAFVAAVYGVARITEKKKEPPYALKGASVVRRSSPPLAVEVSPAEVSLVEPEHVAGALHDRLAPLAEVLGVPALPPVFVIHRADLDAGRFESAHAEKREGVIVRANLGLRELDEDGLIAFTAGEILDDVTRRRARIERVMWIRDGFAEWWAASSDGARREVLLLRALHASREGYGPQDVLRWWTVREELGPPIAAALAWSGLAALEGSRGREAVLALAREVMVPDPPKGVSALLAAPPPPVDSRAWEALLAKEGARLSDRLSRVPRIDGRVEVVARSALSTQLVVETSTAPGVVSVVWLPLGAVDGPLAEHLLERTTRERGQAIVVPRSFARGSRVFVAVTAFGADLGCEVRALASRRTLE